MSSSNNVEKQDSKSLDKNKTRRRLLKRLEARKKRLEELSERLDRVELRLKLAAQALAPVAGGNFSDEPADKIAAAFEQGYRIYGQNLEANAWKQAEKDGTLEKHDESD